MTNIRANHMNTEKMIFAFSEIALAVTSPIVAPFSRIEMISEPKSCMPPKKIDPTTIQINEGTQPHRQTAMMGPMIGPAPAMEEK